MPTPKFQHKAAFTVVGLAGQFTMENNTIHELWDQFNRRANQINHAYHDGAIGLCYHDPDYSADKSFTYMAGFAVSQAEDIPEGMTSRTVPEGDYAVFEHIGPLDTLGQTYDRIYREWQPSSDYDLDSRDDFEFYGARFQYGQSDSVLEIWIPVKQKA